MKALLVNPFVPLKHFYGRYARFGAVLPPYGLACIASYLRRHGKLVDVLDANRLALPVATVVERVQRAEAGIVGLYATTVGYGFACELARAIQRARPDVKLILGGPHAIGERGNVLATNPDFDFCCGGEGESLMLRLLDCLETGKADLGGISGLCWRRGDQVVVNPVTDVVELDEIPSPSREIDDFTGYHQKIFAYRRTPFTNIQMTRGCPFKCVFCSSPIYLKTVQTGRLRFHSIDWLDQELDYLVNHRGIREIYFVDDTFNVKRDRVHAICDLIIRKYPTLIWSCNFEVKIASREMLEHMKRAGCWSVMIGVESGSQEILDRIKKGITIEEVLRVSDWCHELGLMGRASFIIGHPGETRETVNQTLDLARRVRLPFVTFSLMTPFPGSEFFGYADKYGEWTYQPEQTTLSKVNYVPFGLDAEFLANAQSNAYWKVYGDMRRNLSLLRYLREAANLEFFFRTAGRLMVPA